MGFSLYGHELSEEITPLEARLAWALSLDKAEDFIGKEALLEQQRSKNFRRLRGFIMLGKGIPRQGYEVLNAGDEMIGMVSSGTHSPSLQRGIGLAFLAPDSARLGQVINIAVRGRQLKAELVKLPFVPSHIKKSNTAKI
jgi:aminomethyltransferase